MYIFLESLRSFFQSYVLISPEGCINQNKSTSSWEELKKKIKILEVGLTKSFSPIYDLPIHKVKKGRVHLGGPL